MGARLESLRQSLCRSSPPLSSAPVSSLPSVSPLSTQISMQSDPPAAHRPHPPAIRHNIVIFGETGGGKSSVVNMLTGSSDALVSSRTSGCTLQSDGYNGTISDQAYTFWDTVGLNEGDLGKVPDMKAVASLYHMLRKLEGGVSLLVFVMKASRNTWDAAKQNWELFKHIICQDKVPVVIVVTYLEQVDMGAWWDENKDDFIKRGIKPSQATYRDYGEAAPVIEETGKPVKGNRGAACITATKGKLRKGEYLLQEEYDQSAWKMKKLIYEAHLDEPWRVPSVQWFRAVVREVRSGHWMCPDVRSVTDYLPGQGVNSLKERWGLKDEEEAKKIARALEAGSAD